MNFQIQLGKYPQYVKTSSSDIAKGRLDILVTRNDENLFVLEIKEPGHTITENDIKQGISYASVLFPQQAPFTVISTGSKSRIFETTTRKELTDVKESNYFKNGYHISFNPELRYEAFKFFTELDSENLLNFCKRQVENRLLPLKSKLYIPEILIERKEISNSVESFLKSDQRTLLITGNSGVGKTNFLCSLSEKLLNSGNYALFFPASMMSKDLESTIVEDFNWELDHNKNIIQYVQQLSFILRKENKNLIICVDAIDEYPRPNSNIELNEFITRIKNEPIKWIFTCKTTRAEKFLSISGIPTNITNTINNVTDAEARLKSIIINDFSDWEVNQAAWRYGQYYGTVILLMDYMRKKLKNPFLLRIFFEVYSSLSEEDRKTISSHQIYREYLKKILNNAPNKPLAIQALGELAQKMLSTGKEILREEDLDSSLYESIEYLSNMGIITIAEDEQNRPLLFFNSDDIKKYVTCYYALKLDTVTSEKLESIIQDNKNNFFISELLVWYRKQETDTEKRQMLQDKLYILYEELGREILSQYDSLIKSNFPFLKTKKGVVFFCEPENLSIYAYALKDLEGSDNKVSIEQEFDPSVFNKYHFSTFRRVFGYLFEDLPLIDEIKDYLLFEIGDHIRNGDLDETKNFGLLKERLFNILYFLHISNLFPSNPYEIIAGTWVFIRMSIDSIINAGKSIHPSLLEAKIITKILEDNNVEPVAPLLPLGDEIVIGKSSFSVFKDGELKNYEVTDPLIYRPYFYSNEKLILFIESFYNNFFVEYKAIIDKNFPNHKEHFSLYNNLPCRLIGEIEEVANIHGGDFNTRLLRMSIFKNNGDRNEVKIILKQGKSIFDEKNFTISLESDLIKLETWIEWSTKDVSILFAPKGIGKNNEILRQFLYSHVDAELSKNPIKI